MSQAEINPFDDIGSFNLVPRAFPIFLGKSRWDEVEAAYNKLSSNKQWNKRHIFLFDVMKLRGQFWCLLLIRFTSQIHFEGFKNRFTIWYWYHYSLRDQTPISALELYTQRRTFSRRGRPFNFWGTSGNTRPRMQTHFRSPLLSTWKVIGWRKARSDDRNYVCIRRLAEGGPFQKKMSEQKHSCIHLVREKKKAKRSIVVLKKNSCPTIKSPRPLVPTKNKLNDRPVLYQHQHSLHKGTVQDWCLINFSAYSVLRRKISP